MKEAQQMPLEPAAVQPESNGTLAMGEGNVPERKRQEHANGDPQEGADESRAMQATSAGIGQATKGSASRGVPEPHLYQYS